MLPELDITVAYTEGLGRWHQLWLYSQCLAPSKARSYQDPLERTGLQGGAGRQEPGAEGGPDQGTLCEGGPDQGTLSETR